GHDADDRVVFDTTTGSLYYDADGSGAGAAQLIASLDTGTLFAPSVGTVAASDIVVLNGSAPPGAVINGTAGNDSLVGGPGNDTPAGGVGSDTLAGGPDADSFIFNLAPGAANAVQIADFASGVDKIRLDGRVMAAVGPSGDLSAGDARFYAAAGANGGHD